MAIKCRNYHFCLSGLFHLSGMGENLFGQNSTTSRPCPSSSTPLLLVSWTTYACCSAGWSGLLGMPEAAPLLLLWMPSRQLAVNKAGQDKNSRCCILWETLIILLLCIILGTHLKHSWRKHTHNVMYTCSSW